MVSVDKLSRNNQITTQLCDKTLQKMKLSQLQFHFSTSVAIEEGYRKYEYLAGTQYKT